LTTVSAKHLYAIMDTFSPIVLYGYEIIIPNDGKFAPEDPDPDDEFLDDEEDDKIADMYLNNSVIGYYYGNIPNVTLPDKCGLCVLLTNGSIATSETHRNYLKGTYGLFIGVIVTPDMTMGEIADSHKHLLQYMNENEILKKINVNSSPIFIAGTDVSHIVI